MKNPQTFAIDVSKNIEAIGKYGCLAMCYLYCAGIEVDSEVYIRAISQAMNVGLIDSDCTVLDAEKFLNFTTGKRYAVNKKNYSSIDQIKEPTPARYTYNGFSHWVVVQNGRIVFNSLLNSNCVTKGKLAQSANNPNARIVKLIK